MQRTTAPSKLGLLLLFVGVICLPWNISASPHSSDVWKYATASRKLTIQRPNQVQLALRDYLDNPLLQQHLKDFVSRCGSISRLKSLGKSANGTTIWALEISDKPGVLEPEPYVKLLGNIHGNEPVGRVLTVAFAEWLCANHKTNEIARRIVRNSHLWLVPAVNPDGFAAGTRENLNGVDLNRDFPDQFSDPTMTPTGKEQPETSAIMNWLQGSKGFVSSISYHEGALVANYPWDGTANFSTYYHACPDDATFRFLASSYAKAHLTMISAANAEFPTGITNGAAWYPIYGGMQDWNYIRVGSMELTLEISDAKWPAKSQLATIFEQNFNAIIRFIEITAFGGVSGKVMVETLHSRRGGAVLQPVEANVTIDGSDMVTKSHAQFGDYHRALAPGKYTVVVRKQGYPSVRTNITVPASGQGAVCDVLLRQKPQSAATRKALSALALGEQRRYNAALLFIGFGVLWGLWVTHQRMIHRSMMRQRSV